MRTVTRLPRLSSLLVAGALVAAVSSSASRASAAPPGKGSLKVAHHLLTEGERALKKKDFSTALGKYRASDDAQPSAVARLGEARALVGLGQLAAAEQMYLSVLHDAHGKNVVHPPPGAVREEAALAMSLPYVTLVVKGADPAHLKDVSVSIDGEVITDWSTQHPVDPGNHFARAEAPGLETVEAPFKASEGVAQTVTLTFHGAPVSAYSRTSLAQGEAGADSTPSSGHARRTAGWVVLGAGVAGLAFGGVTGALAAKKHSTLSGDCPNGVCPQSESSDLSSYHTLGTLSTVGLIAGGVLAAGGLVLVLLPTHEGPAAETGEKAAGSAANGRLRIQPLLSPGLLGTAGEWTF
jgi:hypothetical protein